ncbi:hypothetical protein FOZ63_029687, partial [Perkinsus olseni]
LNMTFYDVKTRSEVDVPQRSSWANTVIGYLERPEDERLRVIDVAHVEYPEGTNNFVEFVALFDEEALEEFRGFNMERFSKKEQSAERPSSSLKGHLMRSFGSMILKEYGRKSTTESERYAGGRVLITADNVVGSLEAVFPPNSSVAMVAFDHLFGITPAVHSTHMTGTAFPSHAEHADSLGRDYTLDHGIDREDPGTLQSDEPVHTHPSLHEEGVDGSVQEGSLQTGNHQHSEGHAGDRTEGHTPGTASQAHHHKRDEAGNDDDDGGYDDDDGGFDDDGGDYDDYDDDGPDYEDLENVLNPAAVQQSSFAEISPGNLESTAKAGRICATNDLGHTLVEGLVAFGVGIGVFVTACGGIAFYIKSKVEEEQRRVMARMTAVYDVQRGIDKAADDANPA